MKTIYAVVYRPAPDSATYRVCATYVNQDTAIATAKHLATLAQEQHKTSWMKHAPDETATIVESKSGDCIHFSLQCEWSTPNSETGEQLSSTLIAECWSVVPVVLIEDQDVSGKEPPMVYAIEVEGKDIDGVQVLPQRYLSYEDAVLTLSVIATEQFIKYRNETDKPEDVWMITRSWNKMSTALALYATAASEDPVCVMQWTVKNEMYR